MIDKLAKLLATENIVVEHRNAPTASFDTKNRILTLPMWKDITPTLETLLVGHEVGHALNTPDSGWSGLVTEEKTICNIVEDARIERKMKIKYPGLRRDFYEGYKELFDKDFFKIKEKNIETMNFLDRLNLHFKIGSFQTIMFQEDEKCFVDDTESAKTWDEVVDITHRIFEFLKKKEEDGDTRGGDVSIQIDEDEDEDEDEDQTEHMESDKFFTEDEEEQDLFSCDTQTSMDDTIAEQLIDDKSKPILYVNVQDKEYKNITLPYTSLLQMFRDEKDAYIKSEYMYRFRNHSNNDDFSKDLNSKIAKQKKISWNNFLNVNSKVVSYLVKEFEMKKAADHYIRQRESKTGVINCNKLHAYKIIDDIFKKTTILPESKNHGLVLFVDFSGSMTENMLGTIEQLLCLTLFCRRINIPHRVYAFTDQTISEEYMQSPEFLDDKIGDICVKSSDKLIELFTEKMRNNQFSEMGQWLLNFADGCNQKNWKFRKLGNDSWYSNCIHLNSTPLNSALIYARKLIVDFKKQTNAQIVNCIVLTDGESTVSQYKTEHAYINFTYHYKWKLIARDVQTKEEFVIQKPIDPAQHYSDCNTDVLVQFLKNRCSVNVICYRIENSNSRIKKTINLAYPKQSEIADINYRKMRKQKYFHMKGYLKFDDYFLIHGGDEIQTEDSLLGDEVYETKNSLAKAFIKVNIRRGVSRVLLSKFIEKIAA
jgi:hypothetical protein